MKFFSYSIPKFIKLNHLDKELYLIPFFLGMAFLIQHGFNLLNIQNPLITNMSFLIPIISYIYLVTEVDRHNYYYNTEKLELQGEALYFMNYAATAYEDNITFSVGHFDKSSTAYIKKPKEAFLEIKNALEKENNKAINNPLRRIHIGSVNIALILSCEYNGCGYGKDLDIDVEFTKLFIDFFNIKLSEEDINKLKSCGVHLSH